MTIPGVTPFGGTLPVEGEPATFPARAEAVFDWLTINAAPEINAVATGINAALNDNGTVLDTAGKAIALTTNAGTLVPTSGTGNAYTITPAVAISAYENGQTFQIRTNRLNAGAVTLSVGGLGAVPVRKVNQDGVTFSELVAGDFRPGEVHVVGYNGGQFELLSTPLNAFERTDVDQTITGARTFTAPVVFDSSLGQQPVFKSTYPTIKFWDTNGSTTHNRGQIDFADNAVQIQLKTSTDALVQQLYIIDYNSSGATRHAFRIGSVDALTVTNNTIRPGNDDITDLGTVTFRFDNIFATNATIQTSDEREKQDFREVSAAERRAAERIKEAIRVWRWKSSVKEKGDAARWHVGPTVQDVIAILQDEGLDPFSYSFVVGRPDETVEQDGEIRHVPMSLRAAELQFFLMAAL